MKWTWNKELQRFEWHPGHGPGCDKHLALDLVTVRHYKGAWMGESHITDCDGQKAVYRCGDNPKTMHGMWSNFQKAMDACEAEYASL
jgi:hypothetical protein